jgi:small subunit ribosomal protein S20
MPIIKSAKKALRQNKKRKAENLKIKNKMKGQIKKMKSFVENDKKKEAQENLDRGYKAIDKAAKKGIIKKNTAARKKSRLAKSINRLNSK